jgi:hypothetical protein
MPTITLANTVDAWVSPDRTSKFGDTRLYVHSTANTYLTFTRPKLPAGSVIVSATLRVFPGSSTGSGSITVNLHHLTSPFDPNAITWASQPTVGTLVSSLTRTWYNGGASMDFSITAEMQAIVDGGAWYGWRISSTSTDSTQWLNSGQSNVPMSLEIVYQSPSLAPTDLYPTGNAKVNDPKPTLSWVSAGSANGDQLSFQIQVASDVNFTTGLYTLNETFSKASSFDLDAAAPTFTALTNGQSRYWRVRVKNTMNLWSPYSAAAQFTYQTAGVVTITAPTGTTTPDPTPTVTWTYSGTQVAYQVLVAPQYGLTAGDRPSPGYDSGILYGTTSTMDLPQGIILYDQQSITITVRVWSNQSVVSVTGVPSWDQATKTIQWVPTGATPASQILITAEVQSLPARLIRWQYTGGTVPAYFVLYRARYGVAEAWWNLTPAQTQEGATQWYRYIDRIPPGRADVSYGVLVVWPNGSSSTYASSPVQVVHMDHKMPWIVSVSDPTNRVFCLVNYDIDPGLSEISSVITPVAGNPYLVTQSMRKFNGQAAGEITWSAVEGHPTLTGEVMRANFMWLRENPRVYMVWADQAIEAFIYNTSITPFGTADGRTDYAVSFNFVQV